MDKVEVNIKVPNETRYLGLIGKIGEDVARTLKRYKGDREELAYHVNLVLTEAMTNAIRHANEGDPSKKLHIVIRVINQELKIRVYDEGRGFKADKLPEPDFEGTKEYGRGVYIMRSIMDRVRYRKLKNGFVLEMSKSLA